MIFIHISRLLSAQNSNVRSWFHLFPILLVWQKIWNLNQSKLKFSRVNHYHRRIKSVEKSEFFMIFLGNEKIAFYHGNARKFLFPKSPVKTYSESDREMLLKCTPKYEGVLQPKFGKNLLYF